MKRQIEVKEYFNKPLCAAFRQICRENETIDGIGISEGPRKVHSPIISEKFMRENILNELHGNSQY